MDYHIYNFNILMHTDINNLQHQCLINKDTYNICQNKYFWIKKRMKIFIHQRL